MVNVNPVTSGRGRRGQGGSRSSWKDSAGFEMVQDPLTFFVDFKEKVTVRNIKTLLYLVQDATTFNLGKNIKIDFKTEEEAARVKKELEEMKFEVGKVTVDYSRKKRNRQAEKSQDSPTKKAKVEENMKHAKVKEDQEEDEEEGEDVDEEENEESSEDDDEDDAEEEEDDAEEEEDDAEEEEDE